MVVKPAFVSASNAHREPLARRLPAQEEPQLLPASVVVAHAMPVGRKDHGVLVKRHNVNGVAN